MIELRTDRPWETLALTAALPADRELLAVLLELDARLERIAEGSSEPMLGQIRLAWWRDVLGSDTPPKGEPLIARIAALSEALAWPIAESMLAMVDGWETRLMTPEDNLSLRRRPGAGAVPRVRRAGPLAAADGGGAVLGFGRR